MGFEGEGRLIRRGPQLGQGETDGSASVCGAVQALRVNLENSPTQTLKKIPRFSMIHNSSQLTAK